MENNVLLTKGNNFPSVGAYTYSWSQLDPNMKIGRYCSIAKGLEIMGSTHPFDRFTSSSITYDDELIIFSSDQSLFEESDFSVKPNPKAVRNPIEIGHVVWIGQNVTLSRGIKIVSGAVIAANAVVTKDVPPYAIIGGIPGKILRYRFSDEVIKDLMSLGWWDYHHKLFPKLPLDSEIKLSIDLISDCIMKNSLKANSFPNVTLLNYLT
jgi:acetyltransferase-like isoleucine patch superfamily enzyme